jgi:hypothetical protein
MVSESRGSNNHSTTNRALQCRLERMRAGDDFDAGLAGRNTVAVVPGGTVTFNRKIPFLLLACS